MTQVLAPRERRAEAGTPEAVAPPPGHPRFPLIDALRGAAAMLVLISHTGFITGAELNSVYGRWVIRTEIGVAVFFLISGFLLYRPFAAARLYGAPRTALRDYARRRFLRIVPAYWLALTVLTIFPGLPDLFGPHPWIYYGFLQVYDNNYVLGGIGVAWTLCIEITFYALLPLYAYLVARIVRRSIRLEIVVLAAIAAFSLALRYELRVHAPSSRWLNTLPTHMEWFALGMGLALASCHLAMIPSPPSWARWIARRPGACWALAAGIFLLTGLEVSGPARLVGYGPAEDLRRHLLYGVFALALLAPAVIGDRGGGLVRRVLANRRIAWIGLVSYGIYLWHNSIAGWICQVSAKGSCRYHGATFIGRHSFLYLTLITAVLATAIAAISYYLVERPLLRFKNR